MRSSPNRTHGVQALLRVYSLKKKRPETFLARDTSKARKCRDFQTGFLFGQGLILKPPGGDNGEHEGQEINETPEQQSVQ
ncbi:hypothetical protein CDV31_003809 [Fusarium ambrosium]|uniref:Uncharacterized protein n=1 Tax=Fusarium ambrosium TaxID=131363 RepID=A0A428USZ6_9HYPO|nr:hypothetical protein CDV31_003809 [Fusarium ambrosium]